MSPRNLLDPILAHGIRNTNFFEGRLLSGRDLREQQNADRTHRRHLGRAIGAGVIEGLEVEVKENGSLPVLTVKKGLALNTEGESLALPEDENIALSQDFEKIKGNGLLFQDCKDPPTASIPNGVGIYILVMSPVSGYKERALKNGLADKGIINGCSSRYLVEGVQFRLVELDPAHLDTMTSETRDTLVGDLLSANPAQIAEPARISKLRNIMAHLCFGTERLKDFAADPFASKEGASVYTHYSALDDLHELKLLNDCDVPLALLYWTLDGIGFLDMWSVRRRPYELSPSGNWPTLVSPRREAEAEAMFFQFQEQVAALVRNHTNPSSIRVQDYFRYLPPAGFLPIVALQKPQGVAVANFFDGKTYPGPVYTEGARIGSLVIDSFRFPPIEVSGTEMIRLYLVRENRKLESEVNTLITPIVVFSSPYMSFYGEARFDISRWNYSNYSSIYV